MARFTLMTTNFSSGEIDPLLRARIDLDQYGKGAEILQNVLVQPQGGVTRRPGTRHLFELPSAANPQNGTRMIAFEFDVDNSYLLVFANQRMFVFKDGALITNINGSGDNFLTVTAITSSIIPTMCWTQSANTLIVTQQEINPVRILRGGNDSTWSVANLTFDSIPKYAFALTFPNVTAAGTLTPSDVSGSIKLTSQNAFFAATDVNQYINMSPQGRARIVEFIDNKNVNVVTEVPLFDTSVLAVGKWEIEAGYEDVWSVTRGFPRTCTFHEGRLYFGGSTQRPSTIWGSKVGQFFDFNPDQAYDDDAVEATLDTNTLNVVTDLISGRDLQVFTTGGEFYVPQEGLQPITPATFFMRAVSRIGSREGIRVKQLQTGTLYIQRQGKALNEFQFSDSTLSYVSASISLLSSHLLIEPQELALRKSTSTDEADALYVLNGNGTMSVYSLLRQQNVVAPTRFTTDGLYVDVGVDIEDVYVVVKRTFDGVDYYAVELFDSAVFTDCAFVGAAASGATSLPHEDKDVQVICDGSPQGTETVVSGAVTFQRPSVTKFEVGLPVNVLIRTLPLEPRLSIGPRIGFKKRIVEINALLYETQNIIINNNLVPIRTFDTPLLLDEPVPEFTGTKVLNGVLGYDQDAQISIAQSQPLKLTLLGLEYKMATSGGT
jgi:hypothetical protein